ncbi:hypothetical protein NMY22_g6872 [Coprinellus aureogranulatus]|nr:hypothetical protein NMY22_g6872 [Coprinellus aureogranulatus]
MPGRSPLLSSRFLLPPILIQLPPVPGAEKTASPRRAQQKMVLPERTTELSICHELYLVSFGECPVAERLSRRDPSSPSKKYPNRWRNSGEEKERDDGQDLSPKCTRRILQTVASWTIAIDSNSSDIEPPWMDTRAAYHFVEESHSMSPMTANVRKSDSSSNKRPRTTVRIAASPVSVTPAELPVSQQQQQPLFSDDFSPSALLSVMPTLTNTTNYGEGLSPPTTDASANDSSSIAHPTFELHLNQILSEAESAAERAAKARRRDFDDDHSMSSSDMQSLSRVSSISFATVDSDPGPSRLCHHPSIFGISSWTSQSSLHTSFDEFSPSARSSNSFSVEGSSSLAHDFHAQLNLNPHHLGGNVSLPPLQMLSLSPTLLLSPTWAVQQDGKDPGLRSANTTLHHHPEFISSAQ